MSAWHYRLGMTLGFVMAFCASTTPVALATHHYIIAAGLAATLIGCGVALGRLNTDNEE